MKDQSTTRHLRAVGGDRRGGAVDGPNPADRAAYWARMQALRAERQRLRAG